MKKEMMKYWSEHPIVSGLFVAVFSVFLENLVGEPIIDHYFPVDTASTFIDKYLVDTGYVDAPILEVESLDQQFQIIYESFAEYDEAVQDALVKMGKDQKEVSRMERVALLSELPYLAEQTAINSSQKDEDIKDLEEDIATLEADNAAKQSEIDDYKKRKEAELLASHLIIDGELMNNGDSINNAVARVDGNYYYSQSLLNTYILDDQIKHDSQENSVVVGNTKPEKVKFSWDMVTNSDGVGVYKPGGGETFTMDTKSYSEGLVLTGTDYFYAYLGGEYSKLSFTYGHVDKTAMYDLELTIYALDVNNEAYIVLKTIPLKAAMACDKIEIPLGYATKIMVAMSGGGSSWDANYATEYGLTEIFFYS